MGGVIIFAACALPVTASPHSVREAKAHKVKAKGGKPTTAAVATNTTATAKKTETITPAKPVTASATYGARQTGSHF